MGYSTIYHESALHIYFITCRDRKYSGQNNHEWDVRVEHDGKIGCTTVQYTTALLYSDGLYFPWHGINKYIYNEERLVCSTD